MSKRNKSDRNQSAFVNVPYADDENPGEPDGKERLLSASDLSTIESDDSASTPPPTIPMRKPSLVERRNVNLINLKMDESSDSEPQSPDEDRPGPLIGVGGSRSLRRNSISLPQLNKLDLNAVQQENINNQINDGSTEDAESLVFSVHTEPESIRSAESVDSELDEKPTYRTGFRTARRSSIAPLPSLRLNDKEMLANDGYDAQSMISNQNSITSVNSLASLLKEKIQMFPSMIRRKKKVTSDFKIKIFVTILSMIIVFLVGYAYIMYDIKVLGRSYFESVKLNKELRTIRIFDEYDNTIITGKLGITINSKKHFNCLAESIIDDGSYCFEWDSKARLYMNYEVKDNIKCYKMRWQALQENIYPTDCYDFSDDLSEQWFGGSIIKDLEWPLQNAQFGFAPLITGDAGNQQFGNALRRYFISSKNYAFDIDERTPLYISVNFNNSRQFCMKAQNDDFAFVNRLTPLPELNYKLCIGDDMKLLHQQMTRESLWDGLKEDDIHILHSVLEEPIWQVPTSNINKLNEIAIYNYTEAVVAFGFLRLGHVLINEMWQREIGDFTMDTERFQTLQNTIDILHRRGFKITLSIQPFISTESPNFAEAVANKLLIYERLSERSIPALTRYKSTLSAGVLDVTNTLAIPWLIEKLNRIIQDYKIDSFFIDFGTAYNMPHYYQCNRTLSNPDQYKTLLVNGLNDAIQVIGISGAVSVPRPPIFVSLPPVNSSWEGLQTIVKTVLTYGILGYPFILPGPIGGDYFIPGNVTKVLSYYALETPPLPDKELYIRWLQLATFLPSMRYQHLPSEYKSDDVTEIVKSLTNIRQRTVIPILKKYLRDAMNDGLPIIRPLWMLDTKDAACLSANDEFSIGEELIVAPILQRGQIKREVYLPQGVWKDGVDGSLRKGSRWLHNYRVPENKVAYFVKMPDNTRF